MMIITLNGKDHFLDGPISVADLLSCLKLLTAGLAVAVNDDIIPYDKHPTHLVQEGDRVEVIRAIGGG